jgi:hypothetical protein
MVRQGGTGARSAPDGLRLTADFANVFNARTAVQMAREKYSAFPKLRIVSSLAHPASCRGTYASSRYVECGL